MKFKALRKRHTQYSKILIIFNKHIQTIILSLSLCLGMVKMLSVNHLLPHVSMQKIGNKIEVSVLSHGHHEDKT
jgi:hypothetical protein